MYKYSTYISMHKYVCISTYLILCVVINRRSKQAKVNVKNPNMKNKERLKNKH